MYILLIKVLGSVYINNTANLNKLLYILLSNLYDLWSLKIGLLPNKKFNMYRPFIYNNYYKKFIDSKIIFDIF